MLAALRRLFAGPAAESGAGDWGDVAEWARRRGHGFRRVRDEAGGFVIDGRLEGKPWRLEWGPPQRDYLHGRELRLRMEIELPSEQQMLLMSRPLMDALERRTYEQFVENTQTEIGTNSPEEMRWLVMFPKVDLADFAALRSHFGAVASSPTAGLAWIDGPLAHALEGAATGLLRGDPPFVLMTLRNRSYLRLELATPTAADVAAALGLFETAVTQAIRAAAGHVDPNADWASTASTAWQSLKPDDPADRRKR